MNCRPCHGDSVAGDGPMADGFKLRPINFTDNGTIETIVEGYTFWRVTNGGPGLPTEATPWDSAMPEWKLSLTEEERWKIILGRIRSGREDAADSGGPLMSVSPRIHPDRTRQRRCTAVPRDRRRGL